MPASCQFATGVFILALLAREPDQFLTSSEIADSTHNNPVVIRRLSTALQKAGLVETQKGPGGGIRLARLPRQINLAELYTAVETSDLLNYPPTEPNPNCPVGQAMEKVLGQIFARAELALQRELAQTTLCDVLQMVQKGLPSP